MGKDHRIPSAKVLSGNYASFPKPFKTKKTVLKYYYIQLQVEGYCQVLMEGKMAWVGPGDLLLYQPGEPFHLIVDQNPMEQDGRLMTCGYYFLGCVGDYIEQWWHASHRPHKLNIPLNSSLLAVFNEIVLERRKIDEMGQEISDYLLRILCLLISRAIPQTTSNHLDVDAYLMKDYIEKNATEHFKLDDVARHVGLSVSRATHLFKASFHKTIIQYALEVRLTMACERIKFSTMTLEQIAESSGFGSYSYFHRAFRAKYGMSPKQYRNLS